MPAIKIPTITRVVFVSLFKFQVPVFQFPISLYGYWRNAYGGSVPYSSVKFYIHIYTYAGELVMVICDASILLASKWRLKGKQTEAWHAVEPGPSRFFARHGGGLLYCNAQFRQLMCTRARPSH